MNVIDCWPEAVKFLNCGNHIAAELSLIIVVEECEDIQALGFFKLLVVGNASLLDSFLVVDALRFKTFHQFRGRRHLDEYEVAGQTGLVDLLCASDVHVQDEDLLVGDGVLNEVKVNSVEVAVSLSILEE